MKNNISFSNEKKIQYRCKNTRMSTGLIVLITVLNGIFEKVTIKANANSTNANEKKLFAINTHTI
jgi:hypothetical protein